MKIESSRVLVLLLKLFVSGNCVEMRESHKNLCLVLRLLQMPILKMLNPICSLKPNKIGLRACFSYRIKQNIKNHTPIYKLQYVTDFNKFIVY